MENPPQALGRDALLDLYKLYNSFIKDELTFFHQSFHFYIGLLSGILAATLTGLLGISARNPRGLVLLIGPILILLLSYIGYDTVRAFYRRFTEAWVTKINLELMLNFRQGSPVEPGIRQPVYPSRKGGFIPEIELLRLKKVFDAAERDAWPAEQVAHRLVEVGTTLPNAKWTFILFSVAGLVFFAVIILIVIL